MQIVPAILPSTFVEMIEKASRVEGLVPKIQIDVCDGIFGREKTWLPDGTETLPPSFSYEFDIMLTDWRETMMHCLTLGATSIVAHVDTFSDEDIATLVSMVAPYQIALGISVSNDKAVDFHADMIRKVSALYPNVYIQVMGIVKIGEQGQFFDERTPERVRQLDQYFGTLTIQVDGGINASTAKLVLDAGANTVVVGSYLFGSEDVGGALSHLESIVLDSNC
jgi:ribulose-phosphate 3-epimerase